MRPSNEESASGRPADADLAVVIPARNEERRVGATVRAARGIPGVDVVVVVDDGSSDRTSEVARGAGALVVRHSRNRGKGAALETGAAAVSVVEAREAQHAQHGSLEWFLWSRHLLFLDADLGDTAGAAARLPGPVREGTADMTIAILPPQQRPEQQAGGGHGFVVRLSRDGIERATGFRATQPLSGQRCLTRRAFDAALPFAAGFGVETGMTIDLLRRGFRVVEVEAGLYHRVTGADWRAQVHRGWQYADVARALAVRRLRSDRH